MFSKLIAAAAVAVVSAADVPVFSSNDDYDEINLNIRMLSNTTATATDTATGRTVTGSACVSGTFPGNVTAVTLSGSTAFKTGFCTQVKGVMTSADTCTVTNIADAPASCSPRRARALQSTLDLDVTFELFYSNETLAQLAVAALAPGGTFGTELANGLAATLAAAGYPGVTGVTAKSNGATLSTPPTTGTPAPASPSPSPSSNAAKVAVSTLAAFSAFVASMM